MSSKNPIRGYFGHFLPIFIELFSFTVDGRSPSQTTHVKGARQGKNQKILPHYVVSSTQAHCQAIKSPGQFAGRGCGIFTAFAYGLGMVAASHFL